MQAGRDRAAIADLAIDEGVVVHLVERRHIGIAVELAGLGLDSTRALLTAFGSSQRAVAGKSAIDYAMDRRVTVQFLTSDGEAMTEEMRPRDLQIEDIRKGSAPMKAKPSKKNMKGAAR